jgi:hypothetical protein
MSFCSIQFGKNNKGEHTAVNNQGGASELYPKIVGDLEKNITNRKASYTANKEYVDNLVSQNKIAGRSAVDIAKALYGAAYLSGLPESEFMTEPGFQKLVYNKDVGVAPSSTQPVSNQVYQALGFDKMITPNDRVVFGHPTIGKSFLKTRGEDKFISLDDDYATEINKAVKEIAAKYNVTPYQVKDGGTQKWNKEYNQMMQSMFDKAKDRALSEGKTLFTSNTNLLRNNLDLFDKVINLTDKEFNKRIQERGAKYDVAEWKSQINEAVSKVPQSKVITTDKYLADLFLTPEQEQQAQEYSEQGAAVKPGVQEAVVPFDKQAAYEKSGGFRIINTAKELNLSKDEIKTIYDNYVALMGRKREGKEITLDKFEGAVLGNLQVFKSKNTYIFGEWDSKNNVFKGRLMSSPSIRELYAELDVLFSNVSFMASVPADIGRMLEKKGLYKLDVDKPYDFRGEDMVKNLYFSNKELIEKIFKKSVDKVSYEDVAKYDTFFNYFSLLKRLKESYKKEESGKVFSLLKQIGIYDYNAYRLSKKLQNKDLSKSDVDGVVNEIIKNSSLNKVAINRQDIINNPAVYKELDTELNKSLAMYLSKFGIKTETLDDLQFKLGIDSFAHVDILNKVLYVNKNNQSDYPQQAGKVIAYMMQHNPLVTEITSSMKKYSMFKNLSQDELLDAVGDLISQELHKRTNTALPKSLLDSIAALIRQFFELLSSVRIDRINRNVGIIADGILLQNESLITSSTFKPGAVGKVIGKVSLNEALEKDKFANTIVEKMSPHFILTGSVTLAEQGTVYRPEENAVHDLDWISPLARNQSKKIFESLYPRNHYIREIISEEYTTDTWIVAPDGYTIENLVLEGSNNRIGGYDIVDKNGTVVSSYEPLSDSHTGNVEAKVVDIFSYNTYNEENFKSQRIKLASGIELNIADWRNTFKAKLTFGRLKDIWDYNRFIPYENVYREEERVEPTNVPLPPTTEAFVEQTKLDNNASNALLAKRMEPLLKQNPVELVQVDTAGMIAYNPETGKVEVPVVEQGQNDQAAKDILNQTLVGLFDKMGTKSLEAQSNTVQYSYLTGKLDRLRKQYGDKVEMKDHFKDLFSFIRGYMTDPEMTKWVNQRLDDKKTFVDNMAELVAAGVLDKRILKQNVYEYLSLADSRVIYTPPISSTTLNEMVSEIEEYGTVSAEDDVTTIKVKKDFDIVRGILDSYYAVYGDKISEFMKITENEKEFNVQLSYDLLEKYKQQLKDERATFVAANNEYQLTEVENKEGRMVDAIPSLKYLTDEEKRYAESLLNNGDFPLQCGI